MLVSSETISARSYRGELRYSGKRPTVYVQLRCGRKAGDFGFYVGESVNGHAGRYMGRYSTAEDRLPARSHVDLLLIEFSTSMKPGETWEGYHRRLKDRLQIVEALLVTEAHRQGLEEFCATKKFVTSPRYMMTREEHDAAMIKVRAIVRLLKEEFKREDHYSMVLSEANAS